LSGTVGTWIGHAAATANLNIQKLGLVTVPGKPNDDLGPGTLNSIFKQAGLKK
jgi:HicA toxin of bacterial toxin-antitoxin,